MKYVDDFDRFIIILALKSLKHNLVLLSKTYEGLKI